MRNLAEVSTLHLSLGGAIVKCSRPKRVSTGLPALDRVLGGGLVKGSTTLLAGHPGTGKTTLTLQTLDGLGRRYLYATGEETREHVEATARRIDSTSKRLLIVSERRLDVILEHARLVHASVLAIDSILTMVCDDIGGRAGSTTQLREGTKRLVQYAKTTDTTLWLVGYLTEQGHIAGPSTIEHDIDVVLRLDQEDDERILSCPSKNRFGPTNVVGRLKMTARGLVEAS